VEIEGWVDSIDPCICKIDWINKYNLK
jgi:hypothetical protein